MAPLSTSPVCVPLTKMTVRGSSISFGSLASRARLDRAFLGFLEVQRISRYGQSHECLPVYRHGSEHSSQLSQEKPRAMHVIVCAMAQRSQLSHDDLQASNPGPNSSPYFKQGRKRKPRLSREPSPCDDRDPLVRYYSRTFSCLYRRLQLCKPTLIQGRSHYSLW
jgi:hypothetical protein